MKYEKRLFFLILFSCLTYSSSYLPKQAATNIYTSRSAAVAAHNADYIEYYAIQPRAGKQYSPYYTTVRCKQYYRKPGKRPQCLEHLPIKSINDNGNTLEISRLDNHDSNSLDQQRPLIALPEVIRVPIQSVGNQKPSKEFLIHTPIAQTTTSPYQRTPIDFDAQAAELSDILGKSSRAEPTSLLDFIFGHFKERRRTQEQIAATYLKHYGESR